MITLPSQNDLATTFVHLHNTDVPVKVIEVSTAPTAVTITGEKDLLNCRFPPGGYAVGAYDGGR
jgi:hypothetical protein